MQSIDMPDLVMSVVRFQRTASGRTYIPHRLPSLAQGAVSRC